MDLVDFAVQGVLNKYRALWGPQEFKMDASHFVNQSFLKWMQYIS